MTKEIIIYTKRARYNQYYKVIYNCHLSNRGFKVATPIKFEEISKYEYYNNKSVYHYITSGLFAEIHEIGNEKFFERIGY